jgi:hypothetical protein
MKGLTCVFGYCTHCVDGVTCWDVLFNMLLFFFGVLGCIQHFFICLLVCWDVFNVCCCVAMYSTCCGNGALICTRINVDDFVCCDVFNVFVVVVVVYLMW